MADVVVLHAPHDAAVGQRVISAINGKRAVAVSIKGGDCAWRLGEGIACLLLWSKAAAALKLECLLEQIADQGGGSLGVVHLDDTPLPAGVRQLAIGEINFTASDEGRCERLVRVMTDVAPASVALAAPTRDTAMFQRGLGIGVTVGLGAIGLASAAGLVTFRFAPDAAVAAQHERFAESVGDFIAGEVVAEEAEAVSYIALPEPAEVLSTSYGASRSAIIARRAEAPSAPAETVAMETFEAPTLTLSAAVIEPAQIGALPENLVGVAKPRSDNKH